MSAENTPKQSPRSIASTQTSPSRYSKATHLTEFYPYLNGGTSVQSATSSSASQHHHNQNGNKHHHSRQSSMNNTPGHSRRQSLSTVNSYNSFSPSTLDLQTLVTKTDISKTTEAYNDILKASEDYRNALTLVAEAAGNFGVALENGAKCKGSGNAADGLLNASGLYFLVANHQQILAHSVKESFEVPISKEINKFKLTSAKNDEIFKNEIKEKILNLKKQERENMKLSKLKSRNLVAYRSKLLQLTSHIDEIDRSKHDYYQSAFDLVQDTSHNILKQLGSIVRAQVEIYEGIARKGWSGGGLDELITGCPDPFTNEDDYDDEQQQQQQQQDQEDERGINNNNNNNNDNNNDQFGEDITEEEEDDDTIGRIPLKEHLITSTYNGGLVLNGHSGASPTGPVLSHSQSMKSFEDTMNQDDMVRSSTPKETPMNPSVDDSIDDNSFSLPLPGSSSRGNIKNKGSVLDDGPQEEEEEEQEVQKQESRPEGEDEDEDEESPDEEQEKEHQAKLRRDIYHAHSEWRDSDQDTSGTEDDPHKLNASMVNTSLTA